MFFQNDQNLVILDLKKKFKNTKSRMTRFWSFWKNISFHITWNLFVKLDAIFSTNQNFLKRKTKQWFIIDADPKLMLLCRYFKKQPINFLFFNIRDNPMVSRFRIPDDICNLHHRRSHPSWSAQVRRGLILELHWKLSNKYGLHGASAHGFSRQKSVGRFIRP
jgi:hypothetical protein